MRERKHPEQGFRTCLGVIRLANTFGRDRLEAACARALKINARSYSSLHSILKRMDWIANLAPAPRTSPRSPIPTSVALSISIEGEITCSIIQPWTNSEL